MAPYRSRTAALFLVGITLTAVPAFAQSSERRNGNTSRVAAARVPPRERADAGRTQSPQRSTQQPAPQARATAQSRVDTRPRTDSQVRTDSRPRVEAPARAQSTRPAVSQDQHYAVRRPDGYRWDDRRYDNHRTVVVVPAHPARTYVVPYGYRPYGYRPGWSLNLYFGRPYVYGYPATYGYYALQPGIAYGALRIVDAPRDAQVLVDGYYAGVVDNYDGVFQHLNLEAGPHTIEIDPVGWEPIVFDVNVRPGQTITYRANL
jgi:hypothetical protein